MKKTSEPDKIKKDSAELKSDLDMVVSQIGSLPIKGYFRKIRDKISCISHVTIFIIESIIRFPFYLVGLCIGFVIWTIIFGFLDSNTRREQKVKRIYIFSEEHFRDLVNASCPKKMKDKPSSENDIKE